MVKILLALVIYDFAKIFFATIIKMIYDKGKDEATTPAKPMSFQERMEQAKREGETKPSGSYGDLYRKTT